jgi:hypothetical protein
MITQFHTYGDSHASSEHGGWGNIQIDGLKILTNWLGPKLMHSFGRDSNIILNYDQINNNDFICFCFGEIDCRAHVHKYKEKYKESIDELIKKYFEAIAVNISYLKVNVKICIYNIVPPLKRDDGGFLGEIIALGTDEDRLKYTRYMNKKLKEYCKTHGYIFFDVYKSYSCINGYLNKSYSDNNCHIRDSIFISETLEILKNN